MSAKTQKTHIRAYETKDIPYMVEQACIHIPTLPSYAHIKPIPERLHQWLANNVNNNGYWMTHLLVTDKDEIVGCISAYCSMCVFSFDMITNDSFMFILPEWRTLPNAIKLMRTYRDWAIARKATVVSATTTGGYRAEPMGRMIEREGFVQVGTVFHFKPGAR
jgi:GNAT superfamily N-acetyltransferase